MKKLFLSLAMVLLLTGCNFPDVVAPKVSFQNQKIIDSRNIQIVFSASDNRQENLTYTIFFDEELSASGSFSPGTIVNLSLPLPNKEEVLLKIIVSDANHNAAKEEIPLIIVMPDEESPEINNVDIVSLRSEYIPRDRFFTVVVEHGRCSACFDDDTIHTIQIEGYDLNGWATGYFCIDEFINGTWMPSLKIHAYINDMPSQKINLTYYCAGEYKKITVG